MGCTIGNDTLSQLIFAVADTCYNHGQCINGTICVCDPGWTGVSDSLSLEGSSCHIPVKWHPLVFSPLLLLHIRALFFASKQLRPIISRVLNRRRRLELQQKKPRKIGNQLSFYEQFKADTTAARAYDPITALVPNIVYCLFTIVFFVLKAFVPETALASSSPSSVALGIMFLIREVFWHAAQ